MTAKNTTRRLLGVIGLAGLLLLIFCCCRTINLSKFHVDRDFVEDLASLADNAESITSLWPQEGKEEEKEDMAKEILSVSASSKVGERSFQVKDDQFFLNGKPFRFLSGSIHYFRVIPEYWEDRLLRLKALGLNAITVYVAWNWHEVRQGEFDFNSPGKNLRKFLQLAHSMGFLVVLRPGPYICAEWDFGGIPAWTLENGTYPLRTYSEPYIGFVKRFFDALLPQLEDLLYVKSGGPIVMVQVENEYGSFGHTDSNPLDKQYIQFVADTLHDRLGTQVLLFTTDGPGAAGRGTLPTAQVITLVDGCKSPASDAVTQSKYNPKGMSPFFCTETYTGWLTHWGEKHARTKASDVATLVREILEVKNGTGSVSLYMAHGGTNFGFTAGANTPYLPDITSYDYNAPISEGGERGIGADEKDKFAILRDLFLEFREKDGIKEVVPDFPPIPPRKGFGTIPMDSVASLFDPFNLETLTNEKETGLPVPVPGETFGCLEGFLLYEATVNTSFHSNDILELSDFQDRVHIWIDQEFVGKMYRTDVNKTVVLQSNFAESLHNVKLLVEHIGRVNFDPKGMKDTRFGILNQAPKVNGEELQGVRGWSARCLSFSDTSVFEQLKWTPRGDNDDSVPALYRGQFSAAVPADTYMNFHKFGPWDKGVMWVNGFNLGRYWSLVPQQALFAPGPRILSGSNTLVLFEVDKPGSAIESQDQPQLVY